MVHTKYKLVDHCLPGFLNHALFPYANLQLQVYRTRTTMSYGSYISLGLVSLPGDVIGKDIKGNLRILATTIEEGLVTAREAAVRTAEAAAAAAAEAVAAEAAAAEAAAAIAEAAAATTCVGKRVRSVGWSCR